MKKILINALLLHKEFSGVQYSIEYLVDALGKINQPDILFEVLISDDYAGNITESKSLRLKKINSISTNRFKRIYFENFSLPRHFSRGNFHLYHSPACTLPFFSNIESIVTIHDLVPLKFPHLTQNKTAIYYNLVLPKSIAKAKKIVAVSNTVKKDILNLFPNTDANKIDVVYHGISKRFSRVSDTIKLDTVQNKYKLPSKFILFVGNLEPKKNINRIIEAYWSLKMDQHIEHKLVIAGRKGWKYASIFDLCKDKNLHDDIIFPGYIDEDDLPALYSLASAFTFPSLDEGFGFPVLEAMACGCPVIVSNQGALPEISGGICPMADAYSVSSIASAILQVLQHEDYRQQVIGKGLHWSNKFTWEACAEKMIHLYSSTPS